jgi:starvation-inducible outer membrane lipoprotein
MMMMMMMMMMTVLSTVRCLGIAACISWQSGLHGNAFADACAVHSGVSQLLPLQQETASVCVPIVFTVSLATLSVPQTIYSLMSNPRPASVFEDD